MSTWRTQTSEGVASDSSFHSSISTHHGTGFPTSTWDHPALPEVMVMASPEAAAIQNNVDSTQNPHPLLFSSLGLLSLNLSPSRFLIVRYKAAREKVRYTPKELLEFSNLYEQNYTKQDYRIRSSLLTLGKATYRCILRESCIHGAKSPLKSASEFSIKT